MKIKEIKTVIKEYDNESELSAEDKKLITTAREVSKKAYAPYSGFKVGAALLLENGEIIEGNNQENSSSPVGLCAERVAIFYAGAMYPDIPAKALAITASMEHDFIDEPVTPCGSCRQTLYEHESRFNSPIRLILAGKKKIRIIEKTGDLLPLAFDKTYLEG
ncbi:MAG: cytidine deaminase [Bacteroidetes bacterium]|nr:cytidine deaminase [Bacteroidota bacterium]